jgi:tetratricopeptide (TPR) repeat protein
MSRAPETWIEKLHADGSQALLELLSGRASLGRLSAAEPADAMAAILSGAEPESALARSFDAACLDVLQSFRADLLRREGNAFVVGVKRLDTMMSIVRRLLPEQTALDLHQNFVLWNAFFDNFVIDRGLDLRREYFRILALSQDIAEMHGLAPRRLMPLWLSISAESGASGRYDQSYLRMGMIGLRGLPLGDGFSANEDFALQGLARWAASQSPAKPEFMKEWRVLEGDFPRDAGFWTEHVQQAVTSAERELSERTNRQTTTFPAAAWWRDDVDLHPDNRKPVGGGATEPPAREDLEAILREIKGLHTALAPRIDRLFQAHRRYADSTGDVFYLVRTACNIGMRLIQNGHASERQARGMQAVSLARLAFEYDPTNVFAWSLMRDALAHAGRVRDAELVGWEAIRRFPEDEQWRNQLATVLAEYADKPQEAAALLQETIGLFPANPYTRTQLATVLADDLNDTAQAEQVLRAAIADGVGNAATTRLLEKLPQHRTLRGTRRQLASLADESSLSLPAAEARELLFNFEAGLVDVGAVRAFLAQAPADSYVTYVSERTGVSNLPVKTTFALAFDQALRDASPSALRGLIARARSIERPLVDEAIAISEGRVVGFADHGAETENSARFQKLGEVFAQAGVSVERKGILLRDVAASFLSAGTSFMAAA